MQFGKRKYEGQFERGKFNGHGKLYYSNGDSYDGEFLNNMKHGYGILKLDSNKERYEGEFENDRISGRGKLVF